MAGVKQSRRQNHLMLYDFMQKAASETIKLTQIEDAGFRHKQSLIDASGSLALDCATDVKAVQLRLMLVSTHYPLRPVANYSPLSSTMNLAEHSTKGGSAL